MFKLIYDLSWRKKKYDKFEKLNSNYKDEPYLHFALMKYE